MNIRPKLAAALFAFLVLLHGFATSSTAQDAFTKEQQDAIKKLIQETIVKNPSIIRDALIALEREQVVEQEMAQKKSIAENANALFKPKNPLEVGNPKGDVTVVEFFDYNCGFCRRAMKHVVELVDKDKNVRVIFKELPIFGEKSEQAARAAIAANKQGKYFEFHRDLYEKPGPADKAKALRVAKGLGLDIEKLKKDMESPDVTREIEETKSLANKLGIQGTPFYLVSDRIIPGAPDDLYDQFAQAVDDVRKNGCKVGC